MNTMMLSWKTVPEWKTKKLKGAFFTIETVAFILFVAIVAAVILSQGFNTDGAKRTTTSQEIDQIRTAAVQYKAFYAHDANFSDGFPELFDYIDSSDAVDGRRHGPFLTPDKKNGNDGRWTTSGANDLWGNPYKYDSSTNEIYSTCGGVDEEDQIRSYIGGQN